jgi:small-conductance mechanosensitive channel
VLVSSLNFLIHDKFQAHQIVIPFPQRDLHIHGDGLEVKSAREDGAGGRRGAGEPGGAAPSQSDERAEG